MNHKLLSGVIFAVAATMGAPGVWAGQPQAVAADGSDHVGAGAVAADGSDHVGANAVAADGADHVGAGAVAADGSDHVGANAVASDGADRLNANRLAYSRVGVGSDRVASALMTGSYSDQFNSPQ